MKLESGHILTDEDKADLTRIINEYERDEESVRERQITTWKHLKLMWDGFQHTYYDAVAHDWRLAPTTEETNDDQSFYDKPINVFRAYLESLISALSVTVPPIKCYPDDAENALDLATAKAGDKISQLIYRHNDVQLLWVHALYIYCTEGLVACYNYSKSDEKYGTYQINKYDEVDETHEIIKCSVCGFEIDEKVVTEGDVPTEPEMEMCPQCQNPMIPVIEQVVESVTRLVGVTEEPKSRQCMEAYGGLYVKVPNYAKKQADCPYLIWSYETNYALAREQYAHDKELRDKIQPEGNKDNWEAWARLSAQYDGEEPRETVTCRNAWLRPASFQKLDDERCKRMKKLFPKGAKIVLINDIFCEARNESLDEHWTLTHNPLSDYIHHDPLGLLLVSVQEILNDIISLILQTIEHGIPQTFADPTVLNFSAYGQTESLPGSISKATPKSGKSMADSFYEVKTASLSPEVMPFTSLIQSLGQTVSGALPSLFGGQMEDNKTASGYSMARSQALQRLQTTWKVFTVWWKHIFGKTIPQFISDVKDDERMVEKDNLGRFINVIIRKSELEGKIGKIELEANENLPLSWQQVRDIIMKLMELQNPIFLQALAAPENLPVIREALGLTDFYIPGEEDRDKQYEEIQQLLDSEPIQQPPDEMMVMEAMANGQQPPEFIEVPSVEIDPEFDNNSIHFEIIRKWVVGDAGRLAKVENPSGYKNVLLHGMMHKQQMMQEMMMQQQQQMEMAENRRGAPGRKPNEKNQEAPIQGNENVSTQA